MRLNKVEFILIILSNLFINALNAQTSISVAGGDISASDGTVSYSIGQIVYTTNTGTNGYSVAQGVQQPYEISVLEGIEESNEIKLNCSTIPNPTSDFIILNIENYRKNDLNYLLYDVSGKLVASKNIYDKETSIDFSNLAKATYLLKVLNNKNLVKSFKIVKN